MLSILYIPDDNQNEKEPIIEDLPMNPPNHTLQRVALRLVKIVLLMCSGYRPNKYAIEGVTTLEKAIEESLTKPGYKRGVICFCGKYCKDIHCLNCCL